MIHVRKFSPGPLFLILAMAALLSCGRSGENGPGAFFNIKSQRMKNILFFGNSLTAGYGVRSSEAYPALIQKKIDSLGWKFKCINAGISGETSTGGRNRIGSKLLQPVDVLVLELGINDAFRMQTVDSIRMNLQAIIDSVKKKNPDVKIVIAGMLLPPFYSDRYMEDFKNLFPELARKNNATLIPFLLENVGGVRRLNLPDGVHPTAEGYAIVAETVWHYLKPVLEQTS